MSRKRSVPPKPEQQHSSALILGFALWLPHGGVAFDSVPPALFSCRHPVISPGIFVNLPAAAACSPRMPGRQVARGTLLGGVFFFNIFFLQDDQHKKYFLMMQSHKKIAFRKVVKASINDYFPLQSTGLGKRKTAGTSGENMAGSCPPNTTVFHHSRCSCWLRLLRFCVFAESIVINVLSTFSGPKPLWNVISGTLLAWIKVGREGGGAGCLAKVFGQFCERNLICLGDTP